jgi:hypothetical protein
MDEKWEQSRGQQTFLRRMNERNHGYEPKRPWTRARPVKGTRRAGPTSVPPTTNSVPSRRVCDPIFRPLRNNVMRPCIYLHAEHHNIVYSNGERTRAQGTTTIHTGQSSFTVFVVSVCRVRVEPVRYTIRKTDGSWRRERRKRLRICVHRFSNKFIVEKTKLNINIKLTKWRGLG